VSYRAYGRRPARHGSDADVHLRDNRGLARDSQGFGQFPAPDGLVHPIHIIHGFLFYGGTWLVGIVRGRPLPLGVAFLLALGIECAWELAENTNTVIDRYRATNIALDYYGDSVINSVMDIGAMIVGFWLAWIWPVWLTVMVALLMELIVGYWIRDNLILNIIMLIYPVDVINQWQAGS
jgi:hypothetical protein